MINTPVAFYHLRFVLPGSTIAKDVLGEETYLEWSDLDRLLVQLHEVHSIRLKVLGWVDKRTGRSCVECLFPEVMARVFADLGSVVM